MLARQAEDLFWLGRYLERAENTARLLDVSYHAVLESAGSDPDVQWGELLEVLTLSTEYGEEKPRTGPHISRFLLAGEDNRGSVRACVARCRDNARAVRDALSGEMWEAINTFYLDLIRTPVEERNAYQLCATIKTHCHTVTGVAQATMPRGEGFRFFVLGQVIERAIVTCRWLEVRYRRLVALGAPAGFHDWVTVLKSMSAYEAYLRLHRASLEPGRVLEFLLQSRDYPRSVLWCLNIADNQIQRLTSGRTGRHAARLSGRIQADIEFADLTGMAPDDLDSFVAGVDDALYELARAVEAEFFRPGTGEALHSYEAS
jgi:uncharacterized alpha-E superfamily protein